MMSAVEEKMDVSADKIPFYTAKEKPETDKAQSGDEAEGGEDTDSSSPGAAPSKPNVTLLRTAFQVLI